jgi:hypothetical protein
VEIDGYTFSYKATGANEQPSWYFVAPPPNGSITLRTRADGRHELRLTGNWLIDPKLDGEALAREIKKIEDKLIEFRNAIQAGASPEIIKSLGPDYKSKDAIAALDDAISFLKTHSSSIEPKGDGMDIDLFDRPGSSHTLLTKVRKDVGLQSGTDVTRSSSLGDTRTTIRFSNPDRDAANLYIIDDPSGYRLEGGGRLGNSGVKYNNVTNEQVVALLQESRNHTEDPESLRAIDSAVAYYKGQPPGETARYKVPFRAVEPVRPNAERVAELPDGPVPGRRNFRRVAPDGPPPDYPPQLVAVTALPEGSIVPAVAKTGVDVNGIQTDHGTYNANKGKIYKQAPSPTSMT